MVVAEYAATIFIHKKEKQRGFSFFVVHFSNWVSLLKYANSLFSRFSSFWRAVTNEKSSGLSDEEIVIVLGDGLSVKP